jgi:ubiquinol-cytochrome c reductase iron-sulfur subunit
MTSTDHPNLPAGSVPPEPPGPPGSTASTGVDGGPAEFGDLAESLRFNPRHFGIDPGDPWPDDVPKGQDDTSWRYQDDPRGARRAEMRIAFCWTLTLLSSIGLAWVYVAGGQTQAEGALWATAFLGLGVGFILWARDLLPGHDVIASRGHHDVSAQPDRVAVSESLARGVEVMARRPFLYKMLGAVGGIFGLAALFPLASLGPRPHTSLYDTGWGTGTRALTVDGNPVTPTDIPVDGILTVFPEGNMDNALGPTLLINVGDVSKFKIPPARVGWNIGSLVAFSKICTHAGCPASLYNVLTHQLVCPCHQSTFDVLEDCKPVFGPAPRSLPQLPLTTDANGHVVSQHNYAEPVGPGFWNRG